MITIYVGSTTRSGPFAISMPSVSNSSRSTPFITSSESISSKPKLVTLSNRKVIHPL